MSELKVGDVIEEKWGPYLAKATVVAITDRGAVLEYDYNAVLVGFDQPITAPDGTLLAEADQGFKGRAHWAAAKVV